MASAIVLHSLLLSSKKRPLVLSFDDDDSDSDSNSDGKMTGVHRALDPSNRLHFSNLRMCVVAKP